MMPGLDGIEACEQIRSISSLKNSAIAFLTARSEDYSQIAGFNAGADDYINKPVKMKIFLCRIKALLKRHNNNQSEAISRVPETNNNGRNFEIDREKHTVITEGKEIQLPRKEFNILALLSSKPGKVFTREEIFSQVWGDDVIVTSRSIDVHIRKLREKIGNHSIITIKGVGYKLKE
jgi:two-component system alkaline phosphatase synthesis response regulator PhoP